MRRFSLASAVLFFLGLYTMVAFAADGPPSVPPPPSDENGRAGELIPITVQPQTDWMWVRGGEPVMLERVPAPRAIATASDSCTSAGLLSFIYDGETVSEASGSTIVNGFTTDPADPALQCLATAPNPTGYRSAWFQFSAPVGGMLTVRTATNSDYRLNYDTVINVYRDDSLTSNTCSDLVALACNDDKDGYLSQTNTRVEYNEVYYIEVVDYSPGASGPITLNLEASIEPDPDWVLAGTILPSPLSRHAVVVRGTSAYILAGQIAPGSIPVRTDEVYRFDLLERALTPLADMPAGLTPDGAAGYSNTDAELVADEIHFASGFTGDANAYDGTHWIYDIVNNQWRTGLALNWSSTAAGAPVGFSRLVPYETVSREGFYVVGGTTTKFAPADVGNAGDINPTPMLIRYSRAKDPGVTSEIWETNLPDMSRARYAHAAARVGNSVCVVGGLTVNDSNEWALTASGECYDPNSGQWQNNVGALNVPRFNAESIVGPDGRWYVIGGVSSSLLPVDTIEVHDFGTATWTVMPPNFDLEAPAVGWPRGGLLDNDLWIFGGEQGDPRFNPIAISAIRNKLFSAWSGPFTSFLPIVTGAADVEGSTFTNAISLYGGVPHYNQFVERDDIYDVYRFEVTETGSFMIDVYDIPVDDDYDVLLFNQNKQLVAIAQQLGDQPERIQTVLAPGLYYPVVVRDAPPPPLLPTDDPYQIVLFPQGPIAAGTADLRTIEENR